MLTYALKSALFLALMYVPYMLLLRKETFFRFNRILLLIIAALSILLPLCDFHCLAWADSPFRQPLTAVVEPGMPGAAMPVGDNAATPVVQGTPPVGIGLWQVLSAIYVVGVVATFAVKALQALQIYRAIHRGVLWKDRIGGATVYCHASNVPSFSIFGTIVIGEADYRCCADEILCHEQGHIRSRHSWDIVLATLLQVIQWFSPLSWLFADSLRDIHEYEADNVVLRSGVDMHQYQMLLIRKAAGSGSYAFANSFNHSLIKKRITMMLQKKSNPWMRSKALYLIPVALVSLSVVATSEVNGQETGNLGAATASRGKVTNISSDSQAFAGENATAAQKMAGMALPSAADTVRGASSAPPVADSEKVPGQPDKEPEYEGGLPALMELLMRNARYPKIAMECGVTGRIIVQLMVHEDGSVSDIEVQKSNIDKADVRKVEGEIADVVVNSYTDKSDGEKYLTEAEYATAVKALEAEAIRVAGMAKKWKPAERDGKKVAASLTLPVTFRLQ